MRTNYWAKFEQEVCYHIYNKSIDGVLLFKEPENYNFFLRKWKEYLGAYFTVYAYCLIPNHFHFLIKCNTPTEALLDCIRKEESIKASKFLNGEISLNSFLESQFKRFFNSYVASFNNKYNRSGSLLKAKFKRILIRHPAHFSRLLCYIHHNPIHHHLTTNYINWAFCSYLYYHHLINPAQRQASTIAICPLATLPVFKFFVDRNDLLGYRNFVATHRDFHQNYKELLQLEDELLGENNC